MKVTVQSLIAALFCLSPSSWLILGANGAKAEVAPSPSSKAKAVALVDSSDKKLFTGRPSVDAGMRYSSNDWLKTLISTPTSYILKRIRPHLLLNVVICLAVTYYHPTHPKLSIPLTGHSLLAASLGLLLSYRTNSAYARFWEARGHWTSTKVTCRNLAILVKAHIEPHSPKSSKRFMELLAAYPSTLMHLCLGGAAKIPDYAQRVLPPTDDYGPDQAAWPAMHMCMLMQQALHQAVLESRSANKDLVEAAHLNAASHQLDGLVNHMSCCEKILRTPVPWTYSRHTSRFLTLWTGTLPMALVGDMNQWLVLAIVIASSYCMLGIEEIGHLIEQPFLGDPLDGDDKIWSTLNDDGEASALIKRGLATQPYDIGIPVCSLASQIRKEVKAIATWTSGQRH